MSFHGKTKVKDKPLPAPSPRQVGEHAGADYCCGGGNSPQKACLHAGVPAEEILNRLRENSEYAGADGQKWLAAPLMQLTRHIREKHHRYVREAIPRVGNLIENVKARHGENHPEIAEIQKLLAEVGREMIMHMQKEEQILFPYIDALEKSREENRTFEPPFFQTVRNPIYAMMREHDAAGDLVRQIRQASSEYVAPGDACASYTALFQDLREFEADLHEHVHLENNILFPRAVEMENKVT